MCVCVCESDEISFHTFRDGKISSHTHTHTMPTDTNNHIHTCIMSMRDGGMLGMVEELEGDVRRSVIKVIV